MSYKPTPIVLKPERQTYACIPVRSLDHGETRCGACQDYSPGGDGMRTNAMRKSLDSASYCDEVAYALCPGGMDGIKDALRPASLSLHGDDEKRVL